MGRFVAGVVSAVLLMVAGAFLWQSLNAPANAIPEPPPAVASAALGLADVAQPLEATEKTREEKRFSRYDKDKNGAVSREEYLASRRKAYAKLDIDGDGRLSFEEYAVKTVTKFSKADGDRTGALTPAEFLTTRVVRKSPGSRNCPPPRLVAPQASESSEEEG